MKEMPNAPQELRDLAGLAIERRQLLRQLMAVDTKIEELQHRECDRITTALLNSANLASLFRIRNKLFFLR